MAGYIGTQAVSVNTTSATITGDASIGGDLSLGDSDKAIFGAGSDLQIHHDGSNSYITEVGAGALVLQSNGTAIVLEKSDGENMILANTDGAVTLYFNGAAKLATTNTGVNITGTVTATGDVIIKPNAGTSDAGTLRITGGTSGISNLQFADTADANIGMLQYNHTSNYMLFQINNAERMRILSNGNVGIGTAAPSVLLDLESASPIIRLTDSDASGTPECQISGAGGDLIFDADRDNEKASSLVVFKVDGTERMRIDSSGSLGIATTANVSSTSSVAGLWYQADGWLAVARAGNTVAYFNRLTNDGAIAEFRKGGATVGIIGSNSGTNMIMGTGTTGIYFNNASQSVHPWNITGNQARSGAIDLGRATDQFRNVYINGGVVFGPASGSNVSSQTFDDYEEGSWTPAANNGTFGGVIQGRYTKVGNKVTAWCDIQSVNDITTTSALNINGLPFASVGSGTLTDLPGPIMTRYLDVGVTEEMGVVCLIGNSTTSLRIYVMQAGGTYVQVQNSHYSNTAIGIRLTITYQV